MDEDRIKQAVEEISKMIDAAEALIKVESERVTNLLKEGLVRVDGLERRIAMLEIAQSKQAVETENVYELFGKIGQMTEDE